jgi:hypothetical protein
LNIGKSSAVYATSAVLDGWPRWEFFRNWMVGLSRVNSYLIPALAAMILSACGGATNKSTSTPSNGATQPLPSPNGSGTTSGGQSGTPVTYDPATRFNTWGSANPTLKDSPAFARNCEPVVGVSDQVVNGFTIYSNNCVMSYQVTPGRFDQMLADGNFFATELLEKLSLSFQDEFDFIILSLDTGTTFSPPSFPYSGQYQSLGTRLPTRLRRLMGHLQFPYGVYPIIGGPFLHELMHEWGQRGRLPEMGSDEGHWGHVSTQGQLGGFDASTLQRTGSRIDALSGQTIYSYQAGIRPLQAAPGSSDPELCLNYTRGYGTVANGGNSIAFGPFELFLMGLRPAEQTAPLVRLNNAAYKGDVFSGTSGPGNTKSLVSQVEASGETLIEIAKVRSNLGVADPALQPKQTQFRVAYLTITPREVLDPGAVEARRQEAIMMSQQGHAASNLSLGCVVGYNFYTATQGLANIAFGGLREARR